MCKEFRNANHIIATIKLDDLSLCCDSLSIDITFFQVSNGPGDILWDTKWVMWMCVSQWRAVNNGRKADNVLWLESYFPEIKVFMSLKLALPSPSNTLVKLVLQANYLHFLTSITLHNVFQ